MPQYNHADLLAIMERLRAPNGCPWDREQNHRSILSCLVEEAFEFIDAVERDDRTNMVEELGDILLQVVFHAQMAKEAGHFNYEQVVQRLCEKLIHRHPHVFGESQVNNAQSVEIQWEKLKAEEKSLRGENPGEKEPVSKLGQIPRGLPAMPKAIKLQKRAAKVGFDWHDWKGPMAKIREELAEFEAEILAFESDDAQKSGMPMPRPSSEEAQTVSPEREKLEGEFGDILFAMLNLGRFLKVDPERALTQTNLKFSRRFMEIESLIEKDGLRMESLSLEELDQYWEKVKAQERAKTP